MADTTIPPILPNDTEAPAGYEEKSKLTPRPKVVAASVAGALVVVLVWTLHEFANVAVPADVSAALTVIVSFAAGYMKSE